jgi:hypothetical protein
MSKRIIVMTLALAVSAGSLLAEGAAKPAANAEAKQAAAPRLTIVEPVKDFGVVAKGEKLDWSFEIKNTGDTELQIISAKPGCGCTVADFDKAIKPGATGKVTAHVDTTAFAGPIAKTISVETNDPSNPQATLTIHATVKPYVEAAPVGFVRYTLLQGETQSQSLVLYSEEDEPFEIKNIEVPGDWVKVTQTKLTDEKQRVAAGKVGQNQYKLDIVVGGPDSKIGPLADKIHIVTNSKHQPDYFVSVTGVVRPTVRVDPTGVNFGEVAPTDTAATRVVYIRSGNLQAPESLSVTKAESTVPGVTASFKPTPNKGEYEVTLQIGKDAKPGDMNGALKIYTNDSINKIVTVPVRGTVKAATPAPTKSGSLAPIAPGSPAPIAAATAH